MLGMMVTKRVYSLLSSLLLVGALLGLAGCRASPGAGSSIAKSAPLYSVRIQFDTPQAAPDKPIVTLTDSGLAQQLYATTVALPPMPAHLICGLVLGPRYTLTFQRGGETLVTALVQREGCPPVTLTGDAHVRLATPEFWRELDDAIHTATPPAHPTGLAIEHAPNPAQAPQTAWIPSAAVAQRLYDAIMALKWLPYGPACTDAPIPEYQLVFQTADHPVPAIMHSACNGIELVGDYHTRGGWYVMDDQFKRLFQQIIGGATFAPASPDHLTLTIAQMRIPSRDVTVADADLMRRLYQEFFSLRPTQPTPGCPPESDKVAGKGTWYTLSFTQWGLPILQIEVYEGSCDRIDFTLTPQRVVQGDQAFWNLLHQAAHPG